MSNLKSSTRKERVTDSLREKILNGEIRPGEPLRQIPLSKEYKVAQTVIRESLQTLAQQGLVSIISNVGTFVKEMSVTELIGAYQVREVLEGLAARLCCQTASRADIEKLELAVHEIHSKRGKRNQPLRSELERRFHQQFLHLSGNEALIRQSEGYRFIGNIIVTNRDPETLKDEHLAIVKAIADNRPAKAEKFAREHVAASARSIEETMS